MSLYQTDLAPSRIAGTVLLSLCLVLATLAAPNAQSEPLNFSTETLQRFAFDSGAHNNEIASIATDPAKAVVWSARYEAVRDVRGTPGVPRVQDFDQTVERALQATRQELGPERINLVFPTVLPILNELLVRVVNGEDLQREKLTSVQRIFLWELLRALHNGSGAVGDGRGVFAVRSSNELNEKIGWKLPAEIFEVVSSSARSTHLNIWGRSLVSLNRYVLEIQKQSTETSAARGTSALGTKGTCQGLFGR